MARLLWLVFGATVHLGLQPLGQGGRLQMGFKRRAAAALHIFVSVLALAYAVRLPMDREQDSSDTTAAASALARRSVVPTY